MVVVVVVVVMHTREADVQRVSINSSFRVPTTEHNDTWVRVKSRVPALQHTCINHPKGDAYLHRIASNHVVNSTVCEMKGILNQSEMLDMEMHRCERNV